MAKPSGPGLVRGREEEEALGVRRSVRFRRREDIFGGAIFFGLGWARGWSICLGGFVYQS